MCEQINIAEHALTELEAHLATGSVCSNNVVLPYVQELCLDESGLNIECQFSLNDLAEEHNNAVCRYGLKVITFLIL